MSAYLVTAGCLALVLALGVWLFWLATTPDPSPLDEPDHASHYARPKHH